ncbi:MAG: hypothetical protein VW868_03745 [Bacteroidota bacterium]
MKSLPKKNRYTTNKSIPIGYLLGLFLVLISVQCDGVDVTDPNFNDQNIGVWEDWTGGNDYTYLEITSNEVTFYFYNGLYRCSEVKTYSIADIQANGIYTLVPTNQGTGEENKIFAFSKNDVWLHVRDLTTSNNADSTESMETETAIFNMSSKNLSDLDKACGSYPFMGVWERRLSDELTGYLHVTEDVIDVIAYVVPQNCYSTVTLAIESIEEVQDAYELIVQEVNDTTAVTRETISFYVFPNYLLLKRVEEGFAITETYQPSALDVSSNLPSCSN